MKQVELVRQRLVMGLSSELKRFRIWLSCVEGNGHLVERLNGAKGDDLLGKLADTVMSHLGHETEGPQTTDHRANRTQGRKRASGVMAGGA